jgi:hypothetical protein
VLCVNCRHNIQQKLISEAKRMKLFHVMTIILFSFLPKNKLILIPKNIFFLSYTFHMSIVILLLDDPFTSCEAVKYLMIQWFTKAMNLVIIVCFEKKDNESPFLWQTPMTFAHIRNSDFSYVIWWEKDSTNHLKLKNFCCCSRKLSLSLSFCVFLFSMKFHSTRFCFYLFAADSRLFLFFSSLVRFFKTQKKFLRLLLLSFWVHCPLSNNCWLCGWNKRKSNL